MLMVLKKGNATVLHLYLLCSSCHELKDPLFCLFKHEREEAKISLDHVKYNLKTTIHMHSHKQIV